MDSAQVGRLVRAYQTTIGHAQETFGKDSFETKIVIAAIADNARAAKSQLVLPVPGGEQLTGSLDVFVEQIQKADVIGGWFRTALHSASDAGKTLVDEVRDFAIGKSVFPTIVSLAGAVATFVGALQAAGRAIGGGLALLVIGLLAMASRNPALINRGIVLLPRVGAGLQEGAKLSAANFSAAVKGADQLGRRAEKLLNDSLSGEARAFFAAASPPGFGIPARVRNTAKTIFYSATVVIVTCLLIMGAGVYQGFSEEVNKQSCIQAPGHFCPPSFSFSFPRPSVGG